MRVLFDTHIVLWSAIGSARMPSAASAMILDPEVEPWFSVAAIWEIAIKGARRIPDFLYDPGTVRKRLLAHDWHELAIESDHAIVAVGLPRLHKDPFDRIMVGQATSEAMTLVTADRTVARYPGPIRLV